MICINTLLKVPDVHSESLLDQPSASTTEVPTPPSVLRRSLLTSPDPAFMGRV